MSAVDYEFHTVKGKVVRRQGVCFGSYSAYLKRAQNDKEPEDYCWWRTRYRLDPNSIYYRHTTPKERSILQRAFHMLYDDWIADDPNIWMDRYSNGQLRSLWFTAAVPLYVLVNTCSIFRMKDDMPAFMKHWFQVERVFQHMKYTPHPWTIYWIAVNLSSVSNGPNKDWVKQPKVFLGGNTAHMPYDSDWADIDDVKWMQRWNKETLKEGYIRSKIVYDSDDIDSSSLLIKYPLRSQWDEVTKDKTLSYYGRESYFVGRRGKNRNGWIEQEAEARGMMKDIKNKRFDSTFARLYSSASTKRSINLFDFIEEVIIPNNL